MKQGRATSNTYEPKTEPNSKAVNVSTVAEMGAHQVHCDGTSQPLYEGRGYEAPKTSTSTHRSGSQGKH